MKILKIIIVVFFASLAVQCQSKKETQMDTELIVDTQKIMYNGKEIPLGKSLKDIVAVLGRYDRVLPPLEKKLIVRRTYTWDKLGLMVVERGEDDEVKTIPEFYIFFGNLDSPVGQAGKLMFARGRESLKAIIKRNKEEGNPLSKIIIEDIKKDQTTGSKAPKHYSYPFITYNKPINIEGTNIKKGMTIAQVNDLREEKDLGLIEYWDLDMNMKSEAGSTTTKSDGFFAALDPHSYLDVTKKKYTNKYNILYRNSLQELEYILVVHDTGQEYGW